MCKKLIVISFFFFLLIVNSELIAQQLPLFTQYRENHSRINPAIINSDYFTHEYTSAFGISSRLQWSNESFTPRTYTARYEYLFSKRKLAGLLVGGNIISDQFGPMNTSAVSGRIGIQLSSDPYWSGFVGALSFGATQFGFDVNKIESQDPLINDCNCRAFKPDISLGLFAYHRFSSGRFDQDLIYGGLSIPQVFAFNPIFEVSDGNEFIFERVPHYYGLIGFYKYLQDYQFVELSAWVKYVQNAPLNIDINLRFSPVEHFWIGTGYALSSKAIHFELGLLLGENIGNTNTMRIGYGVDIGLSEYVITHLYFGPSHEINISYALD